MMRMLDWYRVLSIFAVFQASRSSIERMRPKVSSIFRGLTWSCLSRPLLALTTHFTPARTLPCPRSSPRLAPRGSTPSSIHFVNLEKQVSGIHHTQKLYCEKKGDFFGDLGGGWCRTRTWPSLRDHCSTNTNLLSNLKQTYSLP